MPESCDVTEYIWKLLTGSFLAEDEVKVYYCSTDDFQSTRIFGRGAMSIQGRS